MKALLLLMPALLLAENYIKGTVALTAVEHIDRPTNNSFHVYKNEFTPIVTLESNYMEDNVDAKLRLSNKFDDGYIERASMAYSDRSFNHSWKTEVGTIETFQGVFSESKMANEQNPFIFKNHGVYNSEFLQGFLDTIIGAQQTYSYLYDCKYIITLKYAQGVARQVSQARSEGAFYGYESEYVNLDYSEPIRTWDLQLDYGNSVTAFFNYADIVVGVEGTDKIPTDIISEYLSVGDTSIFSAGTEFNIHLDRFGIQYSNPTFLVAYDSYQMELSNEGLDFGYGAWGEFIYGAYYATDDITPYVSYGHSGNTRPNSSLYVDKIAGVRYNKNDLTLLAEWKYSDWLQHLTFDEAQAGLASGKSGIELISVQVIYNF